MLKNILFKPRIKNKYGQLGGVQMGRRRKRRKVRGQEKLEWLIIIGILLFALFQKVIAEIEKLIYNMTNLINKFNLLDWSMVAVFIITVVVVIFIFIHGKQTRIAEQRREEEIHKQSQRKLNVKRYAEAEKLKSMQPKEFEIYIGDLFSLMGYESKVTPFTGDGGKDIVLRKGKEISQKRVFLLQQVTSPYQQSNMF